MKEFDAGEHTKQCFEQMKACDIEEYEIVANLLDGTEVKIEYLHDTLVGIPDYVDAEDIESIDVRIPVKEILAHPAAKHAVF